MKRDLTAAQFKALMDRQGFRHDAIGFWRLPPPLDNYVVYAGNSLTRRRTRASHLMQEWARIEAQEARDQRLEKK